MIKKYNFDQAKYRAAMFDYLMNSDEFKVDLLSGKIDTKLLDAWGIYIQHNKDSLEFNLIEQKEFGDIARLLTIQPA